MAAYVIIEIKVKDHDAYREYVEKVRRVVERHEGRYLCRGGAVTPFSGNWNPERIILIEFPSVEAVFKCFNSEEYGDIAHLRERSTEGRAIIVEGGADGGCGLRPYGFEL